MIPLKSTGLRQSTPRAPVASSSALVARPSRDWEVVLRHERKVVLWSAQTDELSVRRMGDEQRGSGRRSGAQEAEEEWEDDVGETLEVISSLDEEEDHVREHSPPIGFCPLCRQTLPEPKSHSGNDKSTANRPTAQPFSLPRRMIATTKDSSYFTLLSEANSRATTPRPTRTSSPLNSTPTSASNPALDSSTINSGYFQTFFRVLEKLGQGGNGVVHLVRHVLNGEGLGLYACKRIAVGDSSPNLLRILREVHLLESLQHPNIITYHHAWVEQSQTSSPFAPAVPSLFVLMQYANGGSLHSFISHRQGTGTEDLASPGLSKADRIRILRSRKLSAVHLLRLDEILSIFEDITEGLAFLHKKGILHLDLKAENVLLHWEEDALLPCAKLSDFGSSDSSNNAWSRTRQRTGGSGTVDWLPPEAWDEEEGRPHCPNRANDLWSLGLILHYLAFFALPYRQEEDLQLLAKEIQDYPGFFPSDAHSLDHGTRHDLPKEVLQIMRLLINRNPARRIGCEEVLAMIRRIRAESEMPSPVAQATAMVLSKLPAPLVPNISNIKSEAAVDAAETNQMVESTLISASPTLRNRPHLLLAAVLALLKVASLDKYCSASNPMSMYFLVLATNLDIALEDRRISLALVALHVLALVLGVSCKS